MADTTIGAAALRTCDLPCSVESPKVGSGEGRRSNGSGGGREGENADLKMGEMNATAAATLMHHTAAPLIPVDGLLARASSVSEEQGGM